MNAFEARLKKLEAARANDSPVCANHNPARYYLEQKPPDIPRSGFKPRPLICPKCYRTPTAQPGRHYYSEMIKDVRQAFARLSQEQVMEYFNTRSLQTDGQVAVKWSGGA